MIELEITPEMLEKAKKKAAEMGRLNNSITKGAGNVTGFLGEEMVCKLYDFVEENNTYDYDLKDKYGRRIEVKTKRQKSHVAPPLYYEGSVADYNTRQRADYYFFCRVTNDYTRGWVIGFLPKDEFSSVSTFLRKGEIDPRNNFTVKANCHNVEYSLLRKPLEKASLDELNKLGVRRVA